MKYLGINLPRKVQNYLKTTKHCWKKAALNMFLKILCPRIGRLNVVKVAVLPKLICECNAVRVLSLFSRVWLFGTIWTIARQAPLSMGFSRQEYWSGLPCPPPEDLPHPEMEPMSPASPALAGRFFTTEPPGLVRLHKTFEGIISKRKSSRVKHKLCISIIWGGSIITKANTWDLRKLTKHW